MTNNKIRKRVWLAFGYVGILLIITLSLVPGAVRPHTGAGGEYEHMLAYALVGFAFGMGYHQLRPRLFASAALVATAAILEVLQNFVPGRNPEIIGFLASSLGAWLGLLGALLVSALGRPDAD